MPFDLDVPRRFASVPHFRSVESGSGFLNEIRIPVPCDDPRTPVVPICLDTDNLRVGDVFLFHRNTVSGRLIELYQSQWCGLSRRAAGITHVGLYGGRGLIWDHNPGQNIRVRTVSSALLPGTRISVSRPTTEMIDSDRLSHICSFLQGQVNYNLLSAVNWRAVLARARTSKSEKINHSEVAVAMVCSSFVATALDYASMSKFTIPEAVVLPGDFVREDRFISLDIEWCRMPH